MCNFCFKSECVFRILSPASQYLRLIFLGRFDSHKVSKEIVIKYFCAIPALFIASYQHFYGNSAGACDVTTRLSYFVLVERGGTWETRKGRDDSTQITLYIKGGRRKSV